MHLVVQLFLSPVFRSDSFDLRYSVKKVFLKIWQNSQENTYVRVSFLIKLQA